MKLINYYELRLPDYSLSYLINGDASGLEDSDIETIDGWLADMQATIAAKFPGCTSDLIIRDGDEGSFTRNPEFGLACDCVDAVYAVWADDEDSRPAMTLPWEDEPEDEPEDDSDELEKAVAEILSAFPAGTLFDLYALELWGNREDGFEVNDAWRIARQAEIPEAIKAAAGRWEVFKVNYLPRARVCDIEETGEPPYGVTLEVDCAPWLEIRPCVP